jgi:Ni/Fe-hydrogenase subunit HybB-like protein
MLNTISFSEIFGIALAAFFIGFTFGGLFIMWVSDVLTRRKAAKC